MPKPRLTKLELQVLDAFWQNGPCSVREVQETFPGPDRPAYTTVQTVVYRLERKKALRLAKRVGKAIAEIGGGSADGVRRHQGIARRTGLAAPLRRVIAAWNRARRWGLKQAR